MMNKSDEINELAKALAKAQGEIENASKNAQNPHFKSKYADLAEVLNTVRPVFSKHGLSVTQLPSYADGVASVETVLMHESGQWLSGVASASVSKNDAQGVGSALTYLRRYSLAAVAGVAQEDDDANAAVGKRPASKPQSAKITPTDGLWDALGPEEQQFLSDIAMEAIGRMMSADPQTGELVVTDDGAADAWAYIAGQKLENDEKAALWTRFDSKQRAAMKRANEKSKGAA